MPSILSTMGDNYDLLGAGALSSLNDVEIMGESIAGVLDDLGAAGQASHVRNTVHQMAQARAIDPNAVAVVQRAYKSVGYMPLGIPQTVFTAAGGIVTKTINVTTSRAMKPHELIIPSTISPFFNLTATVAGVAQNSGDIIPAECYSSAAFRSSVRWNTINTSTPLVMSVSNTDASIDRTFGGMLQGPTLLT